MTLICVCVLFLNIITVINIYSVHILPFCSSVNAFLHMATKGIETRVTLSVKPRVLHAVGDRGIPAYTLSSRAH
jgi:hypothetical protein